MAEGTRRDWLRLALAGVFADALAPPALVFAQSPSESTPFSHDAVLARARDLAKSAFKAPRGPLPDAFANLDFKQYSAIHRLPSAELWASDKLGFALDPLQRGFLFTMPVDLFVVENGEARRVAYDRAAYDFGGLQVPPDVGDIGFSGVRILRASGGEGLQDLAILQGATFLRALARGQSLGVTTRGLAIHTGDAQGEEFPVFRAFWIEKPAPAAEMLVIHALLDSNSVTGAYLLTIHAGEMTIIDAEATIFARANLDGLGIATASGAYLFGPLDRKRPDDARVAVYEIDGLQMLTGANEWLWRPAANRDTLQISSFVDKNPRGFGLLQRDRSFEDFGDDDAHWEKRPSLWIEPIGDWGEGEVRLLEIPSDSETNDNVIAQWRPKASTQAGESLSFAYRQFWCWSPPARPQTSACTLSRVGKLGTLRRFVVEFVGDVFADPAKAAQTSAKIDANPGKIVSNRVFVFADRRMLRVVFDLDPGSETVSELRLVLMAGGQPASETWLYRWTA